MKKDVIYIDIEDDITSIIDKVKGSDAKIVAMVPPKRSTVLNSAVNMKLLKRSAEEAGKRVVLVTSEATLLSLAGGVGLHVTSNLHSKPAVPQKTGYTPAAGDDVIDGGELDLNAPIGELAGVHEATAGADEGSLPGPAAKVAKPPKTGRRFKIPSFDSFRNRLFIIAGAVILLGAGWWWAFQIAPRATVAISAQTSNNNVDFELSADAGIDASDIGKRRFAAKQATIERTVTEPFTPTGKKNVGDKASGQMTIQNCDSSETISVDAGTIFTSPTGLKFESLGEASVPGGTFSNGGQDCDPGEATVTVRAIAPGTKYNLAEATIYDADTFNSNVVGFGGQMSGGTDREVSVVAEKDVADAKKRLQDKEPGDVLSELKLELGDDYLGINETYAVKTGQITSQPKTGEEATSGNVSSTLTYTMLGLKREELKTAVEESLKTLLEGGDQIIYDNGLDQLRFSLSDKKDANTFILQLTTEVFIGPDIDTEQLAREISGKRFSEVQTIVKNKPGVVSVDIDFQPFWVFSAPKADKITIDFTLNNTAGNG